LWDFGGVILSSPFEAFNRYEAEIGLPKDFIRSLNARNPDANAWAKMERSEVSLEGFVELFEEEARQQGHKLDGWRILQSLSGDVRPQMVEPAPLQSSTPGNLHHRNMKAGMAPAAARKPGPSPKS
jgi:putative hydrolase of the HAD superfamily